MSAALATDGNGRLEAAVGYAARGWRVLPLHHVHSNGACSCGRACGSEGKHPRLSQWQIAATTDANQIRAWWAATPSAGVGIATGPASDLFVLDVDPDNGGDATLTTLENTHESLPVTRTVITGSGGMHYCFKWPERVRRDGREWRNSAGKLGLGLDIRGAGGQVVVPPSVSGKGLYAVVTDAPLAEPPDWLLDLLDTPAPLPANGLEAGASVTRLPLASDDDRLSAYVHAVVTAECNAIVTAPDGTQNNAINSAAFALGQLVAVGALTETEAENALTSAARQGNHPDDRAASAIRSGLGAGMQVPRTPWPPPDRENPNAFHATPANVAAYAEVNGVSMDEAREFFGITSKLETTTNDVTSRLVSLLGQLREWQDVPDPTHIVAALAVAVTAVGAEAGEEAAWLLIVNVPSSGKTVAVNLLDKVTNARMDSVTVAGLLSWKGRGKNAVPTGVLTEVETGLLTIGDLSTLLASSDRGGRDEVFSILRRVYDGAVSRALNPEPLHWEGHLNVVGAVTGAIDRYAAHDAQLGARWLYCRLPKRTTTQLRDAARMAGQRGTAKHRARSAQLAAAVVTAARARLTAVEMPEELDETLVDFALVLCWGRAAVPRNGYGKREITGTAEVEEPPRITQQLGTFARGLLALGLSTDQVTDICRRLALDSMPAPRRAVLAALVEAGTEGATAGALARAAGLHHDVAVRTLEELAVIGIAYDANAPDPDEPALVGFSVEGVHGRRSRWLLTDDDAELIGTVFAGGTTVDL